jgi:GAF domain-containing protein
VRLDALVLRLARATAAGLDVPAVLADVCGTAQAVLGVRGVVVAAARGEAGLGSLAGSDAAATRIGRLQRDARGGPLVGVVRSGRAVLTTDLARTGPPELAAAATGAGLTGLMTVPLLVGGVPVGALQLLGDAANPVGPARAEPLAGVLDVLAARLADVEELRRRSAPGAEHDPAAPRPEVETAMFTAVPAGPAPGRAGGVDVPTTRIRLPGAPVGPAACGFSAPLVRLLRERRGAPVPWGERVAGWGAGSAGAPLPVAPAEDATVGMPAVDTMALPAADGPRSAPEVSDEHADRAAGVDPAPAPEAGAPQPLDEDAPDEPATGRTSPAAAVDQDADGEPTTPGPEQPEPLPGPPELLVPVPRRHEPGWRRPSPVARSTTRQVCHPTPPGQRRGC